MLPLDTHIEKGHVYLSRENHGTGSGWHVGSFNAVSVHESVFVIEILHRNTYSATHLKSCSTSEFRLFYYELNVL